MINIINFAKPITGNFLVDIIAWLVGISTSITLGVVLFTVLLKLITLPFDFFSRASMRKNSLLMEEMRPELEKLQKQYADNKQLYNQKMMAVYKKHGYSMFGSCLPTIITLVIFIVAINAFTSYSRFQNQQYFYNMGLSYDSVIYAGMEKDDKYITEDAEGKLVIDYDALLKDFNGELTSLTADGQFVELDPDGQDGGHKIIATLKAEEKETTDPTNPDNKITITVKKLSIKTTNGYVEYRKLIDFEDTENPFGSGEERYLLDDKVLELAKSTDELDIKNEKNNNLQIKRVVDGKTVVLSYEDALTHLYNESNAEKHAKYLVEFAKNESNKDKTPLTLDAYITDQGLNKDSYEQNEFAKDFIRDIRREKAAETFRAENEQFLWVKNIWVTDSPMAHPVESSWATFKATHGYSSIETFDSSNYDELIAKLNYEKTAPNGFFILVVLTAGISFVMQIVTAKSQKAQMELQTVDGQGAQTQKVMKWMMPIMMAFFSFMYTAAFSIYIVISNVLSIGTMFGINYVVDRRFKKKGFKKKGFKEGGAKKNDSEQNVVRGRVYVPKEEPKKEEPKKKKEKKSKVPEKVDFLSGTADLKKNKKNGKK
jgi:YidC/Oxa1 family membrane protein insertase